jgi:hypothetical protein
MAVFDPQKMRLSPSQRLLVGLFSVTASLTGADHS